MRGDGIGIPFQADVQPLLDRAGAASPIPRGSIGRTPGESTEPRSTVLATTFRMIEEQTHPWGIGAGHTEPAMRENQTPQGRTAGRTFSRS